MAKKEDIKEKALKFYELIRKKYPVKGMFLFGSYAKGNPRKDSDIDIGVIIDYKNHKDRINITAKLFHEASKIDFAIEPKCIFLDEYKKHDRASILAEIIRTGIKIV